MDIKKAPLNHAGNLRQTGDVGHVRHVVANEANPRVREQRTVEPPAPSASRGEPFVGRAVAAQIGRISMLQGTDPETGSVAYTRKLSETDRFDKVGIFFEAEAKLTLVDDADAPAVKEKVLAAGDAGSLAGLLPAGYDGKFADFTCKWDRANSRSGADFHDMYGDDAKGTLANAKASCRERRIGDTQDGKFETKLPSSDIQGSAVLGRIECAKSTGPTRRPKEAILNESIAVIGEMNKRGLKTPDARAAYVATLPLEQRENPLVLVGVEVPDFDPTTYKDRVQVDDIRHQLVLVNKQGQDAFLLTLDFVTAKRVDTGKTGTFVEFEIERMDGATNAAGLSELIELQNLVAKQLDLVKSPAPKNARGWEVTE
jgi:hypothetical protein